MKSNDPADEIEELDKELKELNEKLEEAKRNRYAKKTEGEDRLKELLGLGARKAPQVFMEQCIAHLPAAKQEEAKRLLVILVGPSTPKS